MTAINEYTIQQQFATWCDKQNFILLHWHVPNGMKSSSEQGAIFRKIGTKRGVPDYWVLLRNKKLIVIEFKTVTGKLSKEQKEFLDTLSLCEIPNKVCRSSHEAVLFIKENL